MVLYHESRRRSVAALSFLLAIFVVAAVSTSTDAMLPQDNWGSRGCWNLGPGFPDPYTTPYELPACFQLQNGPDCYVCLYAWDRPGSGVCSESPDTQEYDCRACDRWNTPSCPAAP